MHAYGSVAPDGNHVTINPIDAPVKALGSHIVETVVASRGADGWQEVESLAPPNVETTGEYTGPLHAAISVSPDFTESVVITDQPIAGPDSPPGVGLYLHRADGSFIPLTQKNGGAYGYYNVNAVSQDYKHIFFEPAIKQFEDDPYPGYPYGGNAYEWDHGDLKLVGIMPDGTLAPEGRGRAAADERKRIDDHSRRPFGSLPGKRPALSLRAHQRRKNDQRRRTPAAPAQPQSPLVTPRAVGITPDGSKVLFSSRTELTDDANTGELEGVPNQFENIYSLRRQHQKTDRPDGRQQTGDEDAAPASSRFCAPPKTSPTSTSSPPATWPPERPRANRTSTSGTKERSPISGRTRTAHPNRATGSMPLRTGSTSYSSRRPTRPPTTAKAS